MNAPKSKLNITPGETIQLNKRLKKYSAKPIYALIDKDDYELLSQYSWYRCQKNTNALSYAHTNIRNGDKIERVQMHRLIMKAKKGQIVDHIDRNGLNNRKSNLRICTYSQNNSNAVSRKNSRSQYKGVWQRETGSWCAQINKDGVKYNLGSYKTEIEAAQAYNAGARYLHGEFARPNSINTAIKNAEQ